MPHPVNSTAAASAIISLIKQAMAGQAKVRGKDRAADKITREGKAGSSSTHRAPTHDLPALIAARVKELKPDVQDYEHRVLRLVVEASLLQEFGSNLMNAPRFQAMVDQVLHDIEISGALHREVSALIQGLPGQRPPKNKG